MLSSRKVMSILLGLAVSSPMMANAGIQPGNYKADQSGQPKLVVKQDRTKYGTMNYAMLTSSDGRQTGLFKIEDVDGSVFQLTRLYINEQSILTTMPLSQASFAGQTMTDASGETNVILTATNSGRQTGCPASLRFKLDRSDKQSWMSLLNLNASRLRINRDAEIDLVMQYRGPLREYAVMITGADDLQASWSGNYLVSEPIPGIGLMRKRQLDSLNGSGFSLSRNVETVLIPMSSNSGRPALRFARMAGGDSRCMTPSSNIK